VRNFLTKHKQSLILAITQYIFMILFIFLSRLDSTIPGGFGVWNYRDDSFSMYQLISYQFIHTNVIHLYFNLLLFLSISMYLESILKYPKIIKYFLISGFFGGLLHSIFFNQDFSLVGSSGSIMGLLIILAFVSKSNILRLIIFSIFLYEFLNCLVTENDKISHLCHVGGAIGGLVISLVDRKNLRIIK